METLAARVTPAIVNVTVTSRAKANMAGGEQPDGMEEVRSASSLVSNSASNSDGRCGHSSRALSMGWAAA